MHNRRIYGVVILGSSIAALMFALQALEGHLVKWGA